MCLPSVVRSWPWEEKFRLSEPTDTATIGLASTRGEVIQSNQKVRDFILEQWNFFFLSQEDAALKSRQFDKSQEILSTLTVL